MSFFHKVKNIFRGSVIEDSRVALPPIIQVNQNPKEHWDIIGELGDGAFGKVEKAVSRQNRQLLAAAKAIEVQEGEVLEDFLVEIEILTSCTHANIVGLYAAYFHDNKLHMLLEFCGGGAVDGIMIELEKPLIEPQIAYIAKYMNEALIFLHDHNVIHRDLKAGNVLLTQDAVVKLADFGVSAKLKDRNERRDTFIGTPYWMAPEVMMCETFKDQPYNAISDIWSFGITLIEMAQMEPPHSMVSPMRVLIKVQKSDPPTLDNPSAFSANFSHFLTKCLVKNPQDRAGTQELAMHPFIRDANNKKSVLALLAEVTAEVQEEVVVEDDRASVDESLAGSEDQTTEDMSSWSSPSPGPTIPESFRHAAPPVPSSEGKKRAAPPPPRTPSPAKVIDMVTPTAASVTYFEDDRTPVAHSHSDNELKLDTNNGYKTPDHVMSPRHEAMNILDDLNDALGTDNYSPAANSVKVPKEPWMMAPDSPSPTLRIKSTSPESNIRKVVQQVRAMSTSPTVSPLPSRSSVQSVESLSSPTNSSTENVHRNASFHKKGAHMVTRDTDVVVSCHIKQDNKQEGVGRLRDRFESNGSQSRDISPIHQKDTPRIEEGLVKEKMRQVIEEQASINSSFEAKRIAQERRDADAVLFQTQPAVAQIAANFVAPEPPVAKEQPVCYSPVPVRVKQDPASPTKSSSQSSFKNEDTASLRSGEPQYFDNVSTSSDKAPPPEPPVDYDEKLHAKENNPPPIVINPSDSPETSIKSASTDQETPVKPRQLKQPGEPRMQPGEPRMGPRRTPYRQTVTKKTRTYIIDGMQVTSTTLHVLGAKEDMQHRKQQLQDLRRLQREEARQKQELQAEGSTLAEQQEKKFQQEKMGLVRQYEVDMELLERKQKREIEEAEKSQEEEMRQVQKRLKAEQERDLRAFRERLKQEMKIIKQELDMLPRNQRKEAMKVKKEHVEHENHMKEADFMMQLQKTAEMTIARMSQKHKERIAQMERQFLMQRHLLLRAKENSEWELEEKQMGEKYVLHRKLFKDEYFLLRTQMLGRHQKEMQQVVKIHAEEEEELIRALALDRKKLPKVLRHEAKTRGVMFKESLRISVQPMSTNEMNEKLRRFEEQEVTRMKNALEEHDQKSNKKIQALRDKHAATIHELDVIQNEKRKQLLEKERNTMQEHERKYFEMREQWQAELAPRKLMLESRFQEELEAQERFYGITLPGTSGSATPIIPPRFS